MLLHVDLSWQSNALWIPLHILMWMAGKKKSIANNRLLHLIYMDGFLHSMSSHSPLCPFLGWNTYILPEFCFVFDDAVSEFPSDILKPYQPEQEKIRVSSTFWSIILDLWFCLFQAKRQALLIHLTYHFDTIMNVCCLEIDWYPVYHICLPCAFSIHCLVINLMVFTPDVIPDTNHKCIRNYNFHFALYFGAWTFVISIFFLKTKRQWYYI